MIKILRGFPIKRDSADRKALRYAEDRLKEGEAFVIFPEGRISEDGNLIPFLPGVLMIAQRANVPILPVALIGTDNVMPYGEIKPRYAGKRTIVRFGAPVSVSELMGGLKGSAGWQLGAERLSLLVQALQENKPYPKFEAVAEKITVETLS